MRLFRALSLACLGAFACSSQALIVTSAFNGGWFDPESAGQGFTFEWVNYFGSNELLVYFSTFDVDGTPTVLVGQAPITGDNVLSMQLVRPTVVGAAITPGVLPVPVLVNAGTLKLTFFGCQDAKAEFSVQPRPGLAGLPSKVRVGTGSFRLKRLFSTNLDSQRCTGGIVDDVPRNDPPRGFIKFHADAAVQAKMEYEVSPSRAELEFDIRKLGPGSYRLKVDGDVISEFTIGPTFTPQTSRARLRFSSPARPDTQLLTFNPSSRQVEIQQIGTNEVRSRFRTADELVALEVPTDEFVPVGGVVSVPSERREQLQSFFATQSPSSSAAVAESEVRTIDGTLQLEIRTENMPLGVYDVVINAERRGALSVEETGVGGTYGRVQFSNPVRPNSFALDFDPRNADVRLLSQGREIFAFRTAP